MQKILIAVIVAAFLGGAWHFYQTRTPHVFFVDSGDTVANWDFQGSHKDGGELEKRVQDEIKKLEGMLEDEATEPPDYQLYVGIAGQYSLLGDGESSYSYLQKALAIDSEKTGLAWYNMGVLMERLGAIVSARRAYQHAVDTQPNVDSYHSALINFLVKNYSEDKTSVTDAFARAEAQFKDVTFVLQARAEWLEGQGMYREAVGVWEELRAAAPQEAQSGFDSQIARLKAKI